LGKLIDIEPSKKYSLTMSNSSERAPRFPTGERIELSLLESTMSTLLRGTSEAVYYSKDRNGRPIMMIPPNVGPMATPIRRLLEKKGATKYFMCGRCKHFLQRDQRSRCSCCKAVRYCSQNCQVQHWKNGHRQECKAQSLPIWTRRFLVTLKNSN